MKKILLPFFCIFTSIIFGQVTNEGTPASWSLPQQKSAFQPIVLPQLELETLYREDQIKDQSRRKPFRVGVPIAVDYGLNNAGFWTNLSNGDRIWRIYFNAVDAVHLSFNFDEFYLPKGAKIYLYTNDRSDLLGAYTAIQNNDSNQLGTWFVNGDKVWIEYFEPANAIGEGKLHIASVIHGYRLGHAVQKNYGLTAKRSVGFNKSGNCEHDVDCSVGADFDGIKNVVKKSVAFLNMGNGYICSGSLLNNTAQDKTPYLLTAEHCYEDGGGNPSNPALYSMRFNWISPNPVCAQINQSTASTVFQSISGAVLRAKNMISDFMLLEINSPLDPSWDVTYAGWDRTDQIPNFTVGIHHPNGDIMKVSRDDDPPFKSNNTGSYYWVIPGTDDTGYGGTGLGSGWEIGSTEGGSSGSPLFNPNGLVIGQLYGGASECSLLNDLNDNDKYDFYGRFATSWDFGGVASNSLKFWLDPLNTGQTTLASLTSTLAVASEELNRGIKMYPNPSSGIISIEIQQAFGDYNVELFNVLGQSLRKNTLKNNQLDISNLPSAFYYLKITEKETNRYAIKKLILNK
ncbi:T9SS type A sorting domain-containing protein [Flavobacteriaceae bacterium F08102]|nr:T9SS type A sorting domain-containing protein [Flavobacteriaceae bacterium F08102]